MRNKENTTVFLQRLEKMYNRKDRPTLDIVLQALKLRKKEEPVKEAEKA